MAPLPPAFLAWYRNAYPTLQFNPEWLDACVEYLQESDPSAATVPGLIKAVEVQLLSSDLSTSVLVPTPSARRAALTTRTPASARTRLFAGGRKEAVLVQVQRVQDVAHSAGAASEVLREKEEARRMAARGAGAGAGGGGAGRIMDLREGEEDGVDEPKVGVDKVPVFPRGSARLVLSDGETEVVAFERELIPGLGLEEIKLGTKLLVFDVPFVNGIMMLSPKNTVVKGYQVEELEAVKEWMLENGFRERLGMDLLPAPEGAGGSPPPNDENVPPAGVGAPAQRPKPDSDVDMSPPRAAARRPNKAQPQLQPQQPGGPASSTHYSDDGIDWDAVGDADLGFDAGGAGGDEDEEDAMRELERDAAATTGPPPAKKPRPAAARVKAEQPSSGSVAARAGAGAGTGAKTGLSGQVEVLELDSDGDDDEERVSGPKRRKVSSGDGPARSSGQRAGRGTGQAVVLELDSDD